MNMPAYFTGLTMVTARGTFTRRGKGSWRAPGADSAGALQWTGRDIFLFQFHVLVPSASRITFATSLLRFNLRASLSRYPLAAGIPSAHHMTAVQPLPF